MVWSDVALATVSPAKNLCSCILNVSHQCYLCFHRDFETRNMMEVASVCLAVSSELVTPYSFHLQHRVWVIVCILVRILFSVWVLWVLLDVPVGDIAMVSMLGGSCECDESCWCGGSCGHSGSILTPQSSPKLSAFILY